MIEKEALPHKKWGKNHDKPTPNKRGCVKNDNKEHVYELFRVTYTIGVKRHYINTYYCVGCGKPSKSLNRKSNQDKDTYQTITKKNGDYYAVEFTKFGSLVLRDKMDW